MKAIFLLAALCLAFTYYLSWVFMPDVMAFPIIWTAVGLLAIAQVLFFTMLAVNTNRRQEGQPTQVTTLYALGFYCLFSLVMVFVAIPFVAYAPLFIPHAFVLLLLCALVFGLKGIAQRSAEDTTARAADRAEASDRAAELSECLTMLRHLKAPALAQHIDKVECLAERLKVSPGAVQADADAELDLMLRGFRKEVEGAVEAASADSLAEKLPLLLMKLENMITRRERLARR